ncbi:hypothetical protein QTP88_019439 [Uroleucon formosanum]
MEKSKKNILFYFNKKSKPSENESSSTKYICQWPGKRTQISLNINNYVEHKMALVVNHRGLALKWY